MGKHLVYRLYKEEGLALKSKPQRRRRKAARTRQERFQPTAPNQAWSLDFVADQLQDGRRFRSLTIVDVFTRECVAIEVGQSLRGEDVVRTLNRLKHEGRAPKLLFCDNGSEFSSQAMDLSLIHISDLADRGLYHAADAMRDMYEMGDAPSCSTCGAIMVRNGSCYRCMSCGSTSGCS